MSARVRSRESGSARASAGQTLESSGHLLIVRASSREFGLALDSSGQLLIVRASSGEFGLALDSSGQPLIVRARLLRAWARLVRVRARPCELRPGS